MERQKEMERNRKVTPLWKQRLGIYDGEDTFFTSKRRQPNNALQQALIQEGGPTESVL